MEKKQYITPTTDVVMLNSAATLLAGSIYDFNDLPEDGGFPAASPSLPDLGLPGMGLPGMSLPGMELESEFSF